MPLDKRPPASSPQPKPGGPLPPAVPVSSNHPLPQQPASFDVKSTPDAGYDSEAEDPPADYYHGTWRKHDRARVVDAAERKKQRGLAAGWERSARPDAKVSDFFRRVSGEHFYKQPDDLCFATCGAYGYMRRQGFAPAKIIFQLKRPAVAAKIRSWQKFYVSRVKHFADGAFLANMMADLFSKIESEIGELVDDEVAKAPPDAKKINKAQPLPAIVFGSVIGHFPPQNYYSHPAQKAYVTNMALGQNAVVHRPHIPSPAAATTFHQALFANFQPPRALQLPFAGSARANYRRAVTPLVLLLLQCRDALNAPSGHALLADFSDPDHPGIFDPNFGWMEPRQGFCFLDFEQLMHGIWEHYMRNNLSNPHQGMRQIKLRKDEADLVIIAFQLYVQSG